MTRFSILFFIMAAGVFWLVLGAPFLPEFGRDESSPPESMGLVLDDPDSICTTSDQACRDLIEEAKDALRPTPLPLDPGLEHVFYQDPMIVALLGGRKRNEDYWLTFDVFPDPGHGDVSGEMAGVELAFANPVSYTGKVVFASNPCDPFSNEGYIDPDHPCVGQERSFRSEEISFGNVRLMTVQVYLRQGVVANPSYWNDSDDGLLRVIQSIIERQ